ncbi:hypothetical protein MTR67_034581 [Solanum verrucosum]|uniref:Uncharacterized protein n=1 Tax=Solanum verrucosum TaxID=315347 RepID=A0AAF0U8Q3_SOLVR|nr:hypothetical protein MTR67_034581 [Solanum verrucosum]
MGVYTARKSPKECRPSRSHPCKSCRRRVLNKGIKTWGAPKGLACRRRPCAARGSTKRARVRWPRRAFVGRRCDVALLDLSRHDTSMSIAKPQGAHGSDPACMAKGNKVISGRKENRNLLKFKSFSSPLNCRLFQQYVVDEWIKTETQRLDFASFNQDLFKTEMLGGLLDVLRRAERESSQVLPDLFHIVRISEDGLKEFITWKLGTLEPWYLLHDRVALSDIRLWSSPVANRPVHIAPILHLVQQLCLALNDEFRKCLPDILPCCIQVLTDAERFNDYTYVIPILHTLEVFGDEHMHLLFPALIRLFKVDASVEVRCGAIKTLTRLIPCVQVTGHVSSLVHHLKLVLDGSDFSPSH